MASEYEETKDLRSSSVTFVPPVKPLPPSPPLPHAVLPAISSSLRIKALNALCDGSKLAHSSGCGAVRRRRGVDWATLCVTDRDGGLMGSTDMSGVLMAAAGAAASAFP